MYFSTYMCVLCVSDAKSAGQFIVAGENIWKKVKKTEF